MRHTCGRTDGRRFDQHVGFLSSDAGVVLVVVVEEEEDDEDEDEECESSPSSFPHPPMLYEDIVTRTHIGSVFSVPSLDPGQTLRVSNNVGVMMLRIRDRDGDRGHHPVTALYGLVGPGAASRPRKEGGRLLFSLHPSFRCVILSSV